MEEVIKRRRGRKPRPEGQTRNAIVIRGQAEWYEWLCRFAASQGMKPTELITNMVSLQAKFLRFEDEPPRLIPDQPKAL